MTSVALDPRPSRSRLALRSRARPGLVLDLAWRDLRHGWQSTLCLVVAVAAALVPLLLLNGLREGVVTNLIQSLRDDPRITEIRLMRDVELPPEWFDALREDPRVGFLLPSARYISASVRLRSDAMRRPLDVRMRPTAAGDPLLGGATLPVGFGEVIVTERVAIEAGIETGDTVSLLIMRLVDEQQQRVDHPARVVAVLPRDRLQADDILVAPGLETAIERWREGFAVVEAGWPGVRDGAPAAATFASFRLYATDLRDVPSLRDRLLRDGLDVETRAEDIVAALAIEAGLGWVFAAVSALTAVGFVLTLGLHLAASVVEKVRELSLLRLLGMRGVELALLPSFQGMMIALTGSLAASAAVLAIDPAADRLLAGLAGLEGEVSRVRLVHLVLACGAATLAGAAAGSLAGRRAAAIEPSRGLRRD